ncbi:hypothetical protein D3C84_1227300 [compost metagenome]
MFIDGHLEVWAVNEEPLIEHAVDVLNKGLFELKPPISVHPRLVDDRKVEL